MGGKRIIGILAVGSLLILGASLAQLDGEGMVTDSGQVMDLSGEFTDMMTGGVTPSLDQEPGQTMTGMDSGEVLALSLVISGVDNSLLAGLVDIKMDIGGVVKVMASGSLEGQDPPLLPFLHITEVYYDGTDEWIEITNTGGIDFQGNISLSGVKSSLLLLTGMVIHSGTAMVYGDQLAMVSGSWFIGKTGLGLNIADTAAIDIVMTISGQQQDRFMVDQVQVNAYNDKKTSFERFEGTIVPVTSGRVLNALSGYMINPGSYLSTTTKNDDPKTLTGESSGNLQEPLLCDSGIQGDLMKINEIFPGNEKYPPYIELAVQEEVTLTQVSISGTLLRSAVGFSFEGSGRTLPKGSVFLLAGTDFRNSEEIPGVRNHDFSLVSTGNIVLITIGSGQSGQVMDIVAISGNSLGKSYYFGTRSGLCERIFDAVDDFSPGFERKFLKYMPVRTETEIVTILTGYILGANPSCTTSDLENITTGMLATGTIMSGASESGTLPGLITGAYTIRILDIDYDPPGSDTNNEKITLLAHHNSGDQTPLDLSKTFRLKVNGTNKTLPRTLPMDTPTTFTKTFGFPNSTDDGQPVIVTLTYGDHIFDIYTYDPNTIKENPTIKEKEPILTGKESIPQTDLDISGLLFTISWVLPNPIGSDRFEQLGLLITRDQGTGTMDQESGTRIKGQGISGQYVFTGVDLSQGFSLKIGNHTKKLNGYVVVGQENILSGSLGLVNKAACVALRYHDEELTQFCYGKPKEGERISASFSGLETASEEDLDILNTLSLKRIGNMLCIRYADQSILCKRIPASKAETKVIQEQRLYKGFASLVKQYLIENRQMMYQETPLKAYFELLAQDKQLIGKGSSQVDIYGQHLPITDLKHQIAIIQSTLPGIAALFIGADAMRTETADG